jgi:phage terminase large subunit-like protein
LPDDLQIYQAWDLGISTDVSADHTVCTTIGVSDNIIYILDWYREQIGYIKQKQMVKDLAKKMESD